MSHLSQDEGDVADADEEDDEEYDCSRAVDGSCPLAINCCNCTVKTDYGGLCDWKDPSFHCEWELGLLDQKFSPFEYYEVDDVDETACA